MPIVRRFVPHPMLVAALAAALVLSGCGGGGSNDAIPESEAPDATPAEGAAIDALAPLAEELDKVVATVNGTDVTAKKIYEVALLNLSKMESTGVALSEADERALKVMSLALIVDDELLSQEAERAGITVDDAELDSHMQDIQDRFGTSRAFQQHLDEQGIAIEDLRDDARKRLMKQNYLEQLTADVTATDEEARQVYEAMPEQFQEGEQAQVVHVLISSLANDPEARRADAKARAEQVRERALAGESMEELAREYSTAPNAAKGGIVPWFPRGVMVPKFEELAFSLPIGEISEVFETPYGYNVIQVMERKEPVPIPFAEARPTIKVELTKAKSSAIIQQKLEALRAASTVDVFDPGYLPATEDEEEAAAGAPAEAEPAAAAE